MCRLRNIALRDYQESVTTRHTDTRTDRQTDGRTDKQKPDKVIPMCCYASEAKVIPMCRYALQATQKHLESLSVVHKQSY